MCNVLTIRIAAIFKFKSPKLIEIIFVCECDTKTWSMKVSSILKYN